MKYLYFPAIRAWGCIMNLDRYKETGSLSNFYFRSEFRDATTFETEEMARRVLDHVVNKYDNTVYDGALIVDLCTARVVSVLNS